MDENYIFRAAQLATTFELVANPKPGNVHRSSDLKEETFEQFIAGAIVIGPTLSKATKVGVRVGRNEILPSEIRVGELIKEGVVATKKWTGENTNLGVLLLLIPLTAAAGAAFGDKSGIEKKPLREGLSTILKSTTSDDAISVYEAIQVAGPGGLGSTDELSVVDESSLDRIKRENISLYDVMGISSGWDTISKEWVTDMRITFQEGFPNIKKFYDREGDLNSAIVQTFLKILSEHHDSHIVRKYGEDTGRKISEKAEKVLAKGGIFSEEGREAVEELDEELNFEDINPGTTADLIASSLMLLFLEGPRNFFSRT